MGELPSITGVADKLQLLFVLLKSTGEVIAGFGTTGLTTGIVPQRSIIEGALVKLAAASRPNSKELSDLPSKKL